MPHDRPQLCRELENAFYRDDARLTESLRELHTLDIPSGLWAEVSGIRHPRLLELWEVWQMPTAAVAALALVPLTLTLWADDRIDAGERKEAMATFGDTFFFGTIVQDVLDVWLDRRPDATVRQAWAALVGEISRELSGADRKIFADELLWSSRELSHRGKKEKAVFDSLASAFRP